ncbi:MAG: AAA family ATPase [Campylobacteraceae bacterium]|nr:AAA family ATPase [Campylobacteraceae bacterium]
MKSLKQEILQKFKLNKLNITLVFLVILIILLSIVYFRDSSVYISGAEYEHLIDTQNIQKASIEGDKVYLTYQGKRYIVLKDAIDLEELFSVTKIETTDPTPLWAEFLLIIIMAFFLVVMMDFYFRRRAVSRLEPVKEQNIVGAGFEHSFKPVISNTKFSDVAGIDEIKSELFEIVDFLQNPEKYRNFGIKLPKGVLMAGPPGVGKTLIAKAVAGEAGVPFYYESGANFSQMYVGLGAKKVRELFANAKSNAPSIIFIDEIDAVGKSRGEGRNDEREVTLNQLLTEMDGFEENSGVIVIAATNKIDMIDEALLRPGRFDRRVFVSLPNYKDRIEILKLHLKDKNYDLDLSKLSRMSVGFSGAGLATFVNEATLFALKSGTPLLELSHFEAVKGKILFGKRKDPVLSEGEKEIQALYQGAKALTAYWYNLHFDKVNLLENEFIDEDREIVSKTLLENKLKVYLSGIEALRVYKNDVFSNSQQDMQKALSLASDMVFKYAMSESLIPDNSSVLKILSENRSEVNEFLKTMQTPLVEISKQIFAFETIGYEKIREILQINFEGEESNG